MVPGSLFGTCGARLAAWHAWCQACCLARLGIHREATLAPKSSKDHCIYRCFAVFSKPVRRESSAKQTKHTKNLCVSHEFIYDVSVEIATCTRKKTKSP